MISRQAVSQQAAYCTPEGKQVSKRVVVGMSRKLTGEELAKLLKPSVASEDCGPSIVASMSTNCLRRSGASVVAGVSLVLWPA